MSNVSRDFNDRMRTRQKEVDWMLRQVRGDRSAAERVKALLATPIRTNGV